jgi:hypothetical protein
MDYNVKADMSFAKGGIVPRGKIVLFGFHSKPEICIPLPKNSPHVKGCECRKCKSNNASK